MDPLLPVPFDQWPNFLTLFKPDWPKFAYFHNWLVNAIKWESRRPTHRITIYSPSGTSDSNTLLSVAKFEVVTTVVFSLEEPEILLEYLMNTKVLNWEESFMFYFTQINYDEVFKTLYEEKRKVVQIKSKTFENTCNFYFKSKQDCAKLNSDRIPDGFEVRKLDTSNLPLICSLWPHRDESLEKTIEFLTPAIEFNRCIGLFTKDENLLISWCLVGTFGGLQALHTHPDYQRNGFGKFILKTLIKEIGIEDNLDVTLFIVKGNLPSLKLFESLDFKDYGPVVFRGWIKIA